MSLQCDRGVQVVPEFLEYRDHPRKVTNQPLEISRATLTMICKLLLWAMMQTTHVLLYLETNQPQHRKQKILTSCPGLPDGPGGPEGPASP